MESPKCQLILATEGTVFRVVTIVREVALLTVGTVLEVETNMTCRSLVVVAVIKGMTAVGVMTIVTVLIESLIESTYDIFQVCNFIKQISTL